jgi:hypothetical protein
MQNEELVKCHCNNSIPINIKVNSSKGIKIAKPLFMPFFSNHLQIGYRIKLINKEKLKGIKMVLPK